MYLNFSTKISIKSTYKQSTEKNYDLSADIEKICR